MVKKIIAQKPYLCFILIALSLITACKKNNNDAPDEAGLSGVVETNKLQTSTTNRDYLTKDSIFLYAKQTYLWNAGMPSYDNFNPRQYASNNLVLEALKALPSTGKKDKYSFIDNGAVAGQLSGVSGDYGFSANFDSSDTLRVKYVYKTSPADLGGLIRGYAITNINGRVVSRASQSDVDFLNAAIFGSNPSITLTIKKSAKLSVDITINRGSYNINPVLYRNTYTVGAKKVGYLVFNSFTTNASTVLDDAFKKFAADGITELIVDLRYNGGGSVATAEILTNLIAPSAQTGKIMYTTYYNQTMQDGKATILENQKFYAKGSDGVTRLYSFLDYSYKPTMAASNQEFFAKRGAVANLTRVYFIVTGSTASASELVINNLKPIMDVKLIGRKTYGKPVGFFAIKIDKSDLYIPQFQTKNSVNYGDYFDGMEVDKDLADDLTKDFGESSEKLLAQALYFSSNNSFSAVVKNNVLSSTSSVANTGDNKINEQLDHEFRGMVETRKMKFK